MENNVSVALATYNGSKYIEEQLFSIINQTLSPREIIIIDDSSTDNTFEIIKEIQKNYPLIVLKRNQKNLGPIQTFKKAIASCNYDYVALCDQDDVWETNKIELCFNEIKKMDKNVPSIVFTDLKMIDEKGDLVSSSFWEIQNYNIKKIKFRHLLIGNVVTGCTILMNGAMKKEITKMPSDIIMHDHWIALIVFGFGNFMALNQSTIKFRVHENNVTSKYKMQFHERLKYFFDIFFDKKSIYMSENILQAESFLKVYGSRLSEKNFKKLNSFISLKHKSSFWKKIYIGCEKYLLR